MALVAFVLSISGVVWQVFNYTRGAVIRLFPTDQIVITATDALNRNYADRKTRPSGRRSCKFDSKRPPMVGRTCGAN